MLNYSCIYCLLVADLLDPNLTKACPPINILLTFMMNIFTYLLCKYTTLFVINNYYFNLFSKITKINYWVLFVIVNFIS